MENEPEVIRDQMQETRTALTEKLEALESQVSNTVQSATAAVTDTVEAVKASVTGTVDDVKESVAQTVSSVKDTVKDAFDLPGHIERHPWAAMLGSVAVGYLAGRVLNSAASSAAGSFPGHDSTRGFSAYSEALPPRSDGATNGHGGGARKEEKSDEGGGLLGGIAKAFGSELDTIKGLGLAAVAGVVRDLVTQSVPGEIGSRLKEWMDGMTEKMGAKPLSEPLLKPEESSTGSSSQWEERKPVAAGRDPFPHR